MKNILVLYYSQTGQLKSILDSITKPIIDSAEFNVDFAEYKPVNDYPYPWPSKQFFDAMPESVEGIPCKMKPLDIDTEKLYDLVLFGYQVWYLSPSIPATSVLEQPELKDFLKGKRVITVLGVRNMWIMAHKIVKEKINATGANLIGNIVLEDTAHNLISVITIIKWLLHGKKGPFRILPEAGVSKRHVNEAGKFGNIIKEYLQEEKKHTLQHELLKKKAIEISYPVFQMEKNARRIFKIWSGLILKKGNAGDKARYGRVKAFKFYLLFMIFIISPIAELIFALKKLILYPVVKREIKYYKENP